MTYLLDTDILSNLQRGNARIIARLKEVAASDFGITIVTRIEILRGRFDFFRKAESAADILRAQHFLLQSEVALQQLEIVPFDLDAAIEFDRLNKAGLARKVGQADLIVASITLANRATLVTRNLRHFRLVPGLSMVNWMD